MKARRVLVIAAHPDDEALGCGGTMARWAHEGATVHVAFLADGVFSRGGDRAGKLEELDARRAAAHAACDILGAGAVSFGDFPDNCMDTVPMLDIARAVEALVAKYEPDTILTHHAGDVNVDHQRIHQATVTACRPQPLHCVQTLLFFEVVSSTEWQAPGSAPPFVPHWFVDIAGTLDRKLRALGAYAEELRAWPHPRSVEAVEHLARWRGATAGYDAAEAFMVGRCLR